MLRNRTEDQAAGLRRLLAGSAAQRVVFLSSVGPELKNAVLFNLAAALVRAGADVQMLDASPAGSGICSQGGHAPRKCLWQVATEGARPEDAMAEHATGMRMARVSASPLCDVLRTAADTERLSAQLKDFCSGASFWLIDAGADHDQPFLLPEIAAADIVVLTGATPDSIKAAYGGVKTLHSRLARRHFQLLVAGAPADQAELIQQNIAAAANRYLGVSVQALGNIPADDRLWRAGQLERPVIEAFPMADASVALRGIATRLLDSASAGAAQAARALATEGG